MHFNTCEDLCSVKTETSLKTKDGFLFVDSIWRQEKEKKNADKMLRCILYLFANFNLRWMRNRFYFSFAILCVTFWTTVQCATVCAFTKIPRVHPYFILKLTEEEFFNFNPKIIFHISLIAEYRPSCIWKNLLFPIANQFGDSQYEQSAHCQNDRQRIYVRIRESIDHVGQSIFTRLDLLR